MKTTLEFLIQNSDSFCGDFGILHFFKNGAEIGYVFDKTAVAISREWDNEVLQKMHFRSINHFNPLR